MLSKFYERLSDLPYNAPAGTLATINERVGCGLYIYNGQKWLKYATAMPAVTKGNIKRRTAGDKGVNGIFKTIKLGQRPRGSEIGMINHNITSHKGILGDSTVNFMGYGRTSSANAKWQLVKPDGVTTEVNSSQITVGNTKTFPYDASTLNSHYTNIIYIAPYDMKVNGISALWGDTSGTTDGKQYISIWTSPSGVTSSVANAGTGAKTYTLKWIKSFDSTASAGTFNHISDNTLNTDAFDLNAGDWVVVGVMNDEWDGSTSPYVGVNATLYCKVR